MTIVAIGIWNKIRMLMLFRRGFILRLATSTLLCSAVMVCYSALLSYPKTQSKLAMFNVTKWYENKFPPPAPSLEPNHVCVTIQSRLGNQLFQYAAMYGIARRRNFTIVMSADDDLLQYVNISRNVNVAPGKYVCDSFEKVLELNACCTYDDTLMYLKPGKNYRLGDWLQSWKYFRDVNHEIREQFIFHWEIRETANYIVDNLRYKGVGKVTAIGIHIRVGDMLFDEKMRKNGYRMAPNDYVHKAIDFMLSRHKHVVFIVCSDDIKHAKNIIGDRKNDLDIYFFSISPVHDIAILSECDHVIMTVGTFGWWAGFLSNGTVVYYKHPHTPGSNIYSATNYDDFYPPDWIGLD